MGSIDCAECFRILTEKSPLKRINVELCYGYMAPFRLPEEKGFGARLGQGCFQIHEPPYDPAVVAPHLLGEMDPALELQSYSWQNLAKLPSTETQRQELLALQDQAIVDSVAYVKRLKL